MNLLSGRPVAPLHAGPHFLQRKSDLAQQGKNTEPQECPVCLILFGALYLLKRPERIYVSVHLAIVVKSVKF
eukprot:scaffold39077_cov72-Cyclotella_meneghiniana.AAC.3